jgi:ribonuclease HI
MESIQIYTDGSCLKPNGASGWACIGILQQSEKIWQLSGGSKSSTNNRMELTAVIEALEFFCKYKKYVVYSDSLYVIKGIKEWIKKWRVNNWKDVKNPDLWQRLDSCVRDKNIEWIWVKAHNGNKYNEFVDFIAKKESKKNLN